MGQQMTEEQTFIVSVFNHKRDTSPKLKQITWQEICEMVAHPTIRLNKDGQLISPATFEPSYRLKKNFKELSMLALDYDHRADIEKDFAVWEAKGMCCALYTTHSHLRVTEKNPNAEPRFRILLPLAYPIPSKFYPALWQWAQTFTGGKLDEAAKDESRMFYTPAKATPEAPYDYRIADGKLFDCQELNLQGVDEEHTKRKANKNKKPQEQTHPNHKMLILSDERIRQLAEGAKNQEKFKALWNADLPYIIKHYPQKDDPTLPDWSAADQAIVDILCFWTQNNAQVARLWRQSHLNREKLGREDYVARTIEKARESQFASYSDAFIDRIDISGFIEIPEEYQSITKDLKEQTRLKLIAQNTGLLLDAIRLLLLYLGFQKNHSRLLNALIRKGSDRLGVFYAKQSWMLEQYVNNGEKISSEKTVSRDIHALLKEQEKLGIEVIRYWQGFEGVTSRFQNLFMRYALEAINDALKRRNQFNYFWQALEVACYETAERVPRNPVLLSEEYQQKEKESALKRAKRKALEESRKYLNLLLEDGQEITAIEEEARYISAQALKHILKIAERSLGGQSCPPNKTLFDGDFETLNTNHYEVK
jgi:hypothetical protein